MRQSADNSIKDVNHVLNFAIKRGFPQGIALQECNSVRNNV